MPILGAVVDAQHDNGIDFQTVNDHVRQRVEDQLAGSCDSAFSASRAKNLEILDSFKNSPIKIGGRLWASL